MSKFIQVHLGKCTSTHRWLSTAQIKLSIPISEIWQLSTWINNKLPLNGVQRLVCGNTQMRQRERTVWHQGSQQASAWQRLVCFQSQNYTRDASDNKQHSHAHHSQTSDFCTNRVQNALLPHLLKADDLSIFWNYCFNENLKLSMKLKLLFSIVTYTQVKKLIEPHKMLGGTWLCLFGIDWMLIVAIISHEWQGAGKQGLKLIWPLDNLIVHAVQHFMKNKNGQFWFHGHPA